MLVLDENSRIKLISQKCNLETNFTFYNLQLEFMGFEAHWIFTVAYFQSENNVFLRILLDIPETW